MFWYRQDKEIPRRYRLGKNIIVLSTVPLDKRDSRPIKDPKSSEKGYMKLTAVHLHDLENNLVHVEVEGHISMIKY